EQLEPEVAAEVPRGDAPEPVRPEPGAEPRAARACVLVEDEPHLAAEILWEGIVMWPELQRHAARGTLCVVRDRRYSPGHLVDDFVFRLRLREQVGGRLLPVLDRRSAIPVIERGRRSDQQRACKRHPEKRRTDGADGGTEEQRKRGERYDEVSRQEDRMLLRD